jgi:hypothetical protein
VSTIYKLKINLWDHSRTPQWWREAGESWTKQLYQPEPCPVTYIVAINRILGRLALIPVDVHGTIPGFPAEMRNRQQQLFLLGRSDEVGHPGSGSKWYYINSWVMCWPTEHAKKPLTG